MNREMGFSLKLWRLTAPICVMIRGELPLGRIFAPHTSHEGGTVKAPPYRCSAAIWTGAVLPHQRIFPRRRVLPHKRAPVAALVLPGRAAAPFPFQ